MKQFILLTDATGGGIGWINVDDILEILPNCKLPHNGGTCTEIVRRSSVNNLKVRESIADLRKKLSIEEAPGDAVEQEATPPSRVTRQYGTPQQVASVVFAPASVGVELRVPGSSKSNTFSLDLDGVAVLHRQLDAFLSCFPDRDVPESQTPTGTHCSVCGEPQFDTPTGITCSNGHGGVDAREDT